MGLVLVDARYFQTLTSQPRIEGFGDSDWESAYLRFETPAEERAKFTKRLRRSGAQHWPRDWQIVELFSGRGSGILALHDLGFNSVTGVDLSPGLISKCRPRVRVTAGDCRQIPLCDQCCDVVVIHGGLHHLDRIPEDLDQTLAEIQRVLVMEGLLVIVEPWPTPFLHLVHFVLDWLGPFRRVWPKLEALAQMTEFEASTYFEWLGRSVEIMQRISFRFSPIQKRVRWGKLELVARRRQVPPTGNTQP